MKNEKHPYAFKSGAKKQLVIASMVMLSSPVFAQLVNPNETNLGPWSNVHFVYEEQPSISVYTSKEAESVMPSALANDAMMTTDITDVTVWDNSAENHLLVMVINTERKNLTATVFDSNGNRMMHETPIDPGSYRMVEHTGNLKPGTYYLHVLEQGKIIEKEKFVVK
jgi:hypothetical protein